MLARGAAAVPAIDITLDLNRGHFENQGEALSGVRVDLIYRYPGLPEDNLFRAPLVYDLAEDAQGFVATAAALREGATLPAWASGPIVTLQSEHFLALHRPDLVDPQRVIDEAEEARRQLDGKITFPLEDRYLILIAGNEIDYEKMSSATRGPVSAIAQVETSYEVTPDAIRVLGRQMVLHSRRLHQDGEALETLRHELGHLAVAQYTRPYTPAWVSESAAMYLAGTRPATLWRNALRRGDFDDIRFESLTRSANLGVHDSTRESASLEYAYSAAAAWFLVETFGADLFWDFYRSYAEVPPGDLYDRLPDNPRNPGGEQALQMLAVSTTDRSLRDHFGLSLAGLDQRVQEWMASVV